ncbi:MAG: ABC transporter ATP-binding protein [Verrucomicrobiae bacterium]|nr:ABC transporter ATP-binding protein [Verrucomicrobiae bacterium]
MGDSVEYSIEVTNLTKHYGRITAIQDISFTLKRGEIVGFLGPNGAGKSTTMKILTGLIPANSGKAYICGIPVATHPEEIKRKIGYMPENNPLPSDMRVGEYLRFRGRLKEMKGRQLRKRIEYVLELCDLTRARRRVIGGLSKGYRQRIGIAEAILSEPEVIIMDEPTIGLDPHQILKIRDLIGSLRGRMSVIISSHILPEIELTCDRVIIINRGYVVASGTPHELRQEFLPDCVYHLEVSGSSEDLEPEIKFVHPDLSIQSNEAIPGTDLNRVTLGGPSKAEIGEKLIKHLSSLPNVKLRSLFSKKANLEDIFLAATKRSWEVRAEDPDRLTAAPFPAVTTPAHPDYAGNKQTDPDEEEEAS